MRHLILLCFIIDFSSCARIEKKEKTEPTILEYFDIDTAWHHVNDKFYSCFQDTIDSYLEIRFSTRGVFYQPNKYILLKYNGKNWKGVIGRRPVLIGEKSFENIIVPKTGWKNFTDSLVSIDINSLDFRDTEKDSLEKTIIDGETFYMEIITPNQYKIYSYREPGYLIEKYKKSQSLMKFERIFNLLNYNFNDYYKKKR